MKWIVSKNNQKIDVREIPVLDINELRNKIINQYKANRRVVGFFGCNENSAVRIYAILANDFKSELLVSSAYIRNEKFYPSITTEIPAFHMFERELYEEFGIEPVGHPWLKPVRYSKNRFDKAQKIENYPFFKMDGEEIHEVAVGPIHAGVIEPGHFRFMCNGEKVYHLEIQLGYQHRGIEDLIIKNNNRFMSHLAESIAGDTVIGHNAAYSNAMESLHNIKISDKAGLTRVIALELERIAVHIGDLGAVANDIAYLMGNAVFGATRTLVINTLLSICGNRFGRGLIRVGGVTFDIDNEQVSNISKTLEKVEKDVDRMITTMLASASVLSRLEKTGIVSKEKAREIGLVGMAARASGLSMDSRFDHPWGWYKESFIDKEILDSGDVFARTYIRYKEIKQSVHIIKDLLYKIQVYDKDALLTQCDKSISRNSLVVSIVEGWRGEIVHTAITDNDGRLCRYKIKDPSFNNWYGLAFAVRNNGISDFPLCNKSFNLSYCGNDL